MTAIKLDEDLPHDLVPLLQPHGFDVVTVRLQGWTGFPDDKLLAAIQPEKRWLFTADKGFSDIRRYVPGTFHGIVIFRADRESRSAYIRLAQFLVNSVTLDSNVGALIVVSFRGIRIVHP